MEKKTPKIAVKHEYWKRLKNIFLTTKYCSICLQITNDLSKLDVEHFVAGSEDVFTLKEILHTLFLNSVQNILHSGYVCKTCKVSAINCYVFISHTKQNAEIFDHYLRQLDSKIDQVHFHCLSQRNVTNSEKALIVIEKPMKIIQLETYLCNKLKKLGNPIIVKNDIEDDNQLINTGNIRINAKSLTRDLTIDKIDTCKPKTDPLKKTECSKKSNDRSYTCNICYKLFREMSYLRIHKLRLHMFGSQKKDNICSVCQLKCEDSKGLRAHMSIHDPNKKYTCEVCSVDFNSRHLYIQHTKGLNHRAKLNPKMHEVYKIKRRNLKCSICQMDFFNIKPFREHIMTHGPDEMHKCMSCDKKFDSRLKYLTHTKTVQHLQTTGDRQKIKCKYCNYEAYQMRDVKVHFQNKHLAARSYVCYICKRKLTSRVLLEKHIERHSERGDRKGYRMECKVCSKVLGGHASMKRHLRLHTGEHALLEKHNIESHSERGDHKDYRMECKICGKVLCGHSSMKRHLRLHTGERPYQCHLCDMNFLRKSDRIMHIYRKHKEKSVPCPVCKSKFHTIPTMRRHVKRVHWKRDEKFDIRKLAGLTEADYELFEDRRKVDFSSI